MSRAWPRWLACALLVVTGGGAPAQVHAQPLPAEATAARTPQAPAPRAGLDVLLSAPPAWLAGKRVGLVTNPTGVDAQLRSAVDRLAAQSHFQLVALFGPEHGVRGDAQAGDKVASGRDAATGLPVHSLYGERRQPDAAMLAGIDVLLFDIQDVGARFYTYPYTLALVMRAAREAGIPVVVLDRPNPLGGVVVEGPVLDPALASFVGMYPIPIRHGMTIGELARLFNDAFAIGAQLHVVPVQGWSREVAEPGRAMHWVPPSPNMPTADTALVYPGMALLEGTTLSEGRGTTRPFELAGAPHLDGRVLADRLNAFDLPGVRFRAAWFTPTFSKHAGKLCGGVQLHVTDRGRFRPLRTAIALLQVAHALSPDTPLFLEGAPPFFDRLAGVDWLREAILRGEPLEAIEARWQADLADFMQLRARYLLY